jgi:hypothetical protein
MATDAAFRTQLRVAVAPRSIILHLRSQSFPRTLPLKHLPTCVPVYVPPSISPKLDSGALYI